MISPRTTEGTLTVGEQQVPYRITWKKIKNINLRVKSGGQVELSVPINVTQAEAERFLLQKSSWVLRSLKKYASLAETIPPLENGAFLYLGQPLMLHITPGPAGRILLEKDALTVETPEPENKDAAQRVTQQWLEEQSRVILAQALEEARRLLWQYSLPPYTMKLRKMKSRWGSCQPATGIITLNSRLICVPYSCIVAVAAHELTHLLHPNHSPSFYAVLNSIMPLYPKHRQTLSSFASILR